MSGPPDLKVDEGLDETRSFWDRVAADWQVQVGEHGDENRRLNSDPVLWAFLGDVSGKRVLDAGSGTGYLAAKLRDAGARVSGVDFSERMVGIARAAYPGIEFEVDSISELRAVERGAFDAVVSNYVLMDAPDLEGATRAFNRVLKPGGIAVLVFSHPCFPQGDTRGEESEAVTYHWEHSYFRRVKRVDVVDFEEPRLTPDRAHLAAMPARAQK